MTFHECLTHEWLREAENLVCTTHLGMEEIAPHGLIQFQLLYSQF